MKTAVVTGAASGIGLAVAQKFLEEGYAVFGMSRRLESPINHPDFHYLSGDISVVADRERLISSADRIDVLVNVAGVAPKVRADLLEMTEESYDYVMDINLKGTFFLTQLAANKMKQARSGYICNVSSI
ncbi:MAG: SDR family NAD(P)-dependent oxidoreductase, partial [Clostridia bacterium]|nr:SDR family NAD(P)-dependent oxidoreductase [Clostridia bacterium]